jgi:hypothetical protein
MQSSSCLAELNFGCELATRLERSISGWWRTSSHTPYRICQGGKPGLETRRRKAPLQSLHLPMIRGEGEQSHHGREAVRYMQKQYAQEAEQNKVQGCKKTNSTNVSFDTLPCVQACSVSTCWGYGDAATTRGTTSQRVLHRRRSLI